MRHVAILMALLIPSISSAVTPRPGEPYEAPASIPATIKGVSYVTGLHEIDMRKYTQNEKYRGWFDLGEQEMAFRRNRIDQQKGQGIEDIDIIRIKYSDITDLWFGYYAIYKATGATLPTALERIYDGRLGVYVPLGNYLKRKNESPVVIFFKRDGKPVSLVVLSSHARAKALYELLTKQTGLKVKKAVTSEEAQSPDAIIQEWEKEK